MHEVAIVVGSLAAGYVIGSFPTAVLVTRLATHGAVDIRKVGSGNPGGLNTAQAVGKGWGAVVVLIDGAKGFFAAIIGWVIGGPDCAYAGAAASIVGHIFPVWSGFRGGKGVATAAGSVIVVFPAFFPIEAVAAGLVALLTKNAAVAASFACLLWIAASFVWWIADLPNLWGPAPTLALPISQTIGALLVLVKFYASRANAETASVA